MPFCRHLKSYADLITPYEEVRAGFIALALEKNKKATSFVEEAKALKVLALKAETPEDLLRMHDIQRPLLTAAGVSDKAKRHLTEDDKQKAIKNFVDDFLKPAGQLFIDELVYRFLLTKGDFLGGSIRNLAGKLGEWRFTRKLISTCSVSGIDLEYLDLKTKQWMRFDDEPEIEKRVKGLHWVYQGAARVLIYNLTVPMVRKNVDLCLLDCSPNEFDPRREDSAHQRIEKYLALGEIKGGMDPAGADEHWKTANSALERIRITFSNQGLDPKIFFIGAAIENAMAKEIYQQLKKHILSNVANLTKENQIVSLCDWLVKI